MSETTRSAHCQRCTNCSRQYCTADYIHDSTKYKRKISRDSEAHTRQQIILRRTEWLNRNATSGEPKWGQRQSTSRRHSTPSHTNQFGTPSNPAVSNMPTSASWRSCTETRKHQYWQTKKATCSRSRKEPNRVIVCQACSSTWFYRKHWKTTFRAGKRKCMEIYLSDNDHDCLTNMRFADDMLLFASFKEQLQKKIKRSTEKVGLRIHPGKTKILRNQSSNTRKEIEVDNIKVELLTGGRKHETLGPDDYFPATGDDWNQKSNQGCMGDVSQVQRGIDIEKLPAQTSTQW